ncbi:hypothetical protein FRC09_005743 [Ceratobasidium sp. 395]|nr:hypothetical protein FRC09_005743 [Ceratobasidium sp. 395]
MSGQPTKQPGSPRPSPGPSSRCDSQSPAPFVARLPSTYMSVPGPLDQIVPGAGGEHDNVTRRGGALVCLVCGAVTDAWWGDISVAVRTSLVRRLLPQSGRDQADFAV